ncbi:MAG: sulfatase [Verrucomicrobiota bacterium]
MNVIVVCSDTFRLDHLGFLGVQPLQTPHLDRLASESVHFVDFRLCSFPTVLNRIEVFTGRVTFPFVDWGRLPREFPVLSEMFRHHGFETALVTDNPHLMKPEFDFGRGFEFVKFIPGQADMNIRPESDPMLELGCDVSKLDPRPRRIERYRRNAWWNRQQGTNTTEQVFDEAIRRLHSGSRPFFMWVDVFDPHEPWDALQRFQDLYPLDPSGEALFWPRPGKAGDFSSVELENIRRLYRAEVAQVDHGLGRIMESLQGSGLLGTTAVIFCSDHGWYFGEHELVGKMGYGRPTTIYDTLGRIPLLVRHPGGMGAGRRVTGFCQPPDLHGTLLDLAGIPAPPWVQGRSLLLALGEGCTSRPFAVAGCYPRKGHESNLTLWTKDWCFVYSPHHGLPGSELYVRRQDSHDAPNVLADHPAEGRALLARLEGWLAELGVPARRQRQLLQATGHGLLDRMSQRLRAGRNAWRYYRRYRHYRQK